jgi:hypothetical protein
MNKPIIDKENMFITFKLMGQEALTMSQFDLEACQTETAYSSDEWSAFLMEPDVQEYIKTSMTLIRNAQMNKIIKDSSTSRSVGQSQLLNALNNMSEKDSTTEGPTFIYCYVPLNEEQQFAPNILEVDEYGHPKKA